MDDRRRIVVTEYVASKTIPLVRSDKSTLTIRPAVVGVIGTIILHSMLAKSLGVAFHAGNSDQKSASFAVAGTLPLHEGPLVLLAPIARPAARELLLDAVVPVKIALSDSPLLLDPPASEFDRLKLDDAPDVTGAPADPSLAMADEIYKTQITARIERIWRRTISSEVKAENSFQCHAQLEQDEHGNVKEVLLPACGASIAWRKSLLAAIRQASPLPAPPDIRVYRPSLVLQFVGAVAPGDSAEGHQ